MPFINKNSPLPGKPEPFKRPGGSFGKIGPKDDSLFKGRSQISRYEFKRSLEKNKEIRTDLAKKLKLKLYSPEMDAEIKKMEERMPKRLGGFISAAEAKKSMIEEYWNKKHSMEENLKGGVTAKEIKEINKREKEDEFLKKITGITKPKSVINTAKEDVTVNKNLERKPVVERVIDKPIKLNKKIKEVIPGEVEKPKKKSQLPEPETKSILETLLEENQANMEKNVDEEMEKEKVINEPIRQTPVFGKKVKDLSAESKSEFKDKDMSGISKNPDLEKLDENKTADEEENEAFPFAAREYDPGKAMPSAKEQSFSKVQISGKKSKEAAAKSLSKPKLSELKSQQKFKMEEILDKAREHGLLHPPLKSGALSPEEIRQYEILELEKMFPRSLGGFSDETKTSKMIEELSWKIKHMEKNPRNWDEIALEENKLKFLKDIEKTRDLPS